ncbi:uncharacterized protein LOC114532836 [Dendronephthya gigantea]|uniref:uncharacterized protein LOC114532836 n=1 Tax=Dendronephthya gigantea TaxID=151771 RepID=UPI00106AF605|nr:uncharacterized protein LOC114532836 [Dendronephthya gigantea]
MLQSQVVTKVVITRHSVLEEDLQIPSAEPSIRVSESLEDDNDIVEKQTFESSDESSVKKDNNHVVKDGQDKKKRKEEKGRKTVSTSSTECSDRTSDSDISSCSETFPKQRKIAVDLWENVEKKLVEKLPVDINGLSAFKIKELSTKKKMVSALVDGRKWKKNCPTNWTGHSRVRYADCKGSFKCIEPRCPYKVQYGIVNTKQFDNSRDGNAKCRVCGKKAEHVPCNARRYISYGQTSVTVFYYGTSLTKR